MAAGDDRALGALYDAYGHVAYGLAFAITGAQMSAESVVAESFAEAWRTAASFDASQTSALAWFTSIVRRNALGLRKNESQAVVRSTKSGGDRGVRLTNAPTPVGQALNTLTASQREVIELSYFRGLTVGQIAAHLGEPETGARELLRSAMQELRATLSGSASFEEHVVTRA